MMPFPGGIEDFSNGALVLSVAAALLYLFALELQPSWKRSAVKTASTALLAAMAFKQGAPTLLVAGLALGAAGDFFLSRDGERAFLAGLVSFLAAHVAYIVLFHAAGDGWHSLLVGWRIAAALAMIAFSGYVLWVLMGRVPRDMRLPVVAYCAAIVLMGLTSLTTGQPMLIGGAVLFMASDTLLALERFVLEGPSALRLPMRVAVWVFYYAAQFLIALGFIPS